MNKTTNKILALILVVIVVGLFGINQKMEAPSLDLGSANFNYLGYDGVTSSSSTVSSSTVTMVLSSNAGRLDAGIWNTDASSAVYCKRGTASTTVALYEGITIVAKEKYLIGPDNLWTGEVWCLGADDVVVSTTDK